MSPRVVVCTPTKNRRWAWEFSKTCFDSQIVRPEAWIVVDNSSHLRSLIAQGVEITQAHKVYSYDRI